MSDKARLNEINVNIYGVAPSLFDATLTEFLEIDF